MAKQGGKMEKGSANVGVMRWSRVTQPCRCTEAQFLRRSAPQNDKSEYDQGWEVLASDLQLKTRDYLKLRSAAPAPSSSTQNLHSCKRPVRSSLSALPRVRSPSRS